MKNNKKRNPSYNSFISNPKIIDYFR